MPAVLLKQRNGSSAAARVRRALPAHAITLRLVEIKYGSLKCIPLPGMGRQISNFKIGSNGRAAFNAHSGQCPTSLALRP